jgi:Domain of unknown function (DUF4389)
METPSGPSFDPPEGSIPWDPPSDWAPSPSPPAAPGESPRPVRVVVLDPDLHRNRWTVVVRLILAIPLVIWLGLWSAMALLISVISWVIVLIRGRLPESLVDFFTAYVRFSAHVNAYLSFAADRYPSFVGKPGYAVDVEIDPPSPQRRWTVAIRLLLAAPALVFSSTLAGSVSVPLPSSGDSAVSTVLDLSGGGILFVVAVFGWFVCLVRGRMAAGMRDLAVYALGYGAQVTAYLFFLTDRYPSADPACVLPPLRVPRHAIRATNDDDLRRTRLLTLLRLPLCFPHLVWLSLWSAVVVVVSPFAWVIVLLLGRLPRPLHRFFSAWIRAWAQFAAFATLVAGPFPGFVGAPGYPVDSHVDGPTAQHRAVTLFRLVLAIPALMLASVYSTALTILAVLVWFAALVTGRAPSGLQAFGVAAVRYQAQAYAYLFFVTDRYPYASPGLDEDEVPAAASLFGEPELTAAAAA